MIEFLVRFLIAACVLLLCAVSLAVLFYLWFESFDTKLVEQWRWALWAHSGCPHCKSTLARIQYMRKNQFQFRFPVFWLTVFSLWRRGVRPGQLFDDVPVAGCGDPAMVCANAIAETEVLVDIVAEAAMPWPFHGWFKRQIRPLATMVVEQLTEVDAALAIVDVDLEEAHDEWEWDF